MLDAAQLKKYIGRPYEQYNCLDLVKEFYKEAFDLELKNYYEGAIPSSKEVQSLIVSNRGDFVRVLQPQFGDLIVIRIYGIECHLGVYIEGGRFLHSARVIGSCIDRIERYAPRIEGYYRHREVK